jgi:hypothetical protein
MKKENFQLKEEKKNRVWYNKFDARDDHPNSPILEVLN